MYKKFPFRSGRQKLSKKWVNQKNVFFIFSALGSNTEEVSVHQIFQKMSLKEVIVIRDNMDKVSALKSISNFVS